ncbi:MAG: succinate dehydrogenase [Candidatus Eremiobacteraeota bacterium]|nr:succinate dehydrogenase [Candidatus Eremiobacteraeota bacterium]
MKTTLVAHVGAPGFGRTERRDVWWLEPLWAAVGLAIFVAYSTWAALVGNNFAFGPYQSPFYSPYFKPPWWPLSASIFVLWIPLGFRLSCYYYRKAYYRAYFLSPPACAVSEPKHEYTGETGVLLRWLPVVHRWFLYLSILILIWLWVDAIRAFDFDGSFGIGVGTLVMLLNVVLLTAFTLGCHALRSLVGGNVRCFSCAPLGNARYGAWRFVTRFTGMHPWMAWFSLYSVALCDLYIRLCAMGAITDLRIV